MSLTKIGSIGINTGIQLAGVTTVATLHVGSGVTLSSDGDIFATGISTFSEDIKVGSGVTISPDGDGFYTGVVTATTFSGSLAASNLTGALPAISGASLTGIDTDLVSDTSPQLGGNLDVNTKNITFGDSGSASDDRLTFGAGTDLSIYHNGTHNYIDTLANKMHLRVSNGENGIVINSDGAVELYHNNIKRFETDSNGARIVAPEGEQAILRLLGDEADDANDSFRLNAGGGTLKIQDASNQSSWEDNIVINAAGSVELYHDNSKKLETTSYGGLLSGNLQVNTVYPSADSTYDIGTNSTRFANGYFDTLYGNGNNITQIVRAGSTYNSDLDTAESVAGVYRVNTGISNGHSGMSNYGTLFHANNAQDTGFQMYVNYNDGRAFLRGGNTTTFNGNSPGGGYANTTWAEIAQSTRSFIPNADNSVDLGSSSYRWRNLYTTDLQLSNEGKTNDVDGTWGNYTIQEGESDLFLINNRSGKKYKFNLTEVS